ncbi:DUF2892 domain-containing protein [Staphylococcus chromogenes]|nr:DUF2892 domain-containing protein [Staphylococcus chromogenes]
MKTNEGVADRLVRGAIAVVAGYCARTSKGPQRALLVFLAGLMAGTAVGGFCPLYRVLGISTCPVPPQER